MFGSEKRRRQKRHQEMKQFGVPAECVLSQAFERLRSAGVSESHESEDSESKESDSEDSSSKDSDDAAGAPPRVPPERREGDTWQIA